MQSLKVGDALPHLAPITHSSHSYAPGARIVTCSLSGLQKAFLRHAKDLRTFCPVLGENWKYFPEAFLRWCLVVCLGLPDPITWLRDHQCNSTSSCRRLDLAGRAPICAFLMLRNALLSALKFLHIFVASCLASHF